MVEQSPDEVKVTELNKAEALDLFKTLSERLEGKEANEAYVHLGAAIGLIALAIERQHGIDRATTFKMLQRNGYAVLKEFENAEKREPAAE
jgi:methylmalonyl-CoA mutase cobalamin-binding subunit